MYETVADIFEKEPTPAVVATENLIQDAHGQVVRPGTILFPSKPEELLDTKLQSLRKKGEMPNAEFTTTMGTKVYLPMDCAAGFSTQVKDVKLYLPELMAHFTLPVEVKCFAQQQSRHCSKISSITLTEVCEEASITGGLTVEGSEVNDHQFDIPLDLPVQVACIDLTKEELQQSLYARVKSTYESVDRRFATNKKVVVSGDTHDKAQQEFYCAVCTDTAQDVVTVDVPERIYNEVVFGNVKCNQTSSTYKGVQRPSSAGAYPAPKQPVPPLPPHCFERSEDEPYVQFMNRAGATQADTTALAYIPTPSAPLPHSSFGITTVPVAIGIYDVPRRDAGKMPDLRSPTAALSVSPPLPAQDEWRKHIPPSLYSKPLQPVLSSPPQAPPQRQEAIYEEIQPDALDASIYTSLVHDRPTRLVPPSLKRAHTQPQLQTQALGSNPSPVDEVGNIKYLKTLSCNDIIRLLEAMELPQYIDSFMQVSETAEHTSLHTCVGQ